MTEKKSGEGIKYSNIDWMYNIVTAISNNPITVQ